MAIKSATTSEKSQEYYKHRRKLITGENSGALGKISESIRRSSKFLLDLGVMKLSLALVLPLAMFAARLEIVNSTLASKIIEVPKNFCELDRREECKEGECLRYDPKKFKYLDHGLDPYLEREAHDFLSIIFENVNVLKVLEDGLCDWRQFPWQKYEDNVELLGNPEWKTGKAIQIYINKKNYMKHEIQGGRKYYKNYRSQAMAALSFRPEFRKHVRQTYADVAKRYRKRKNLDAKAEVTFVGVHNRRTDYLEFRRKRLGLDPLYEDYFEDAMEYYREEYDHPVFLYVSDEMDWGLTNLKSLAEEHGDMFFVGCGTTDDPVCVGKDFAVLAHSNHTILTHGSFGHWASYFSGGEIYTEYGAIVPDAYA